VWRTLVRTSKGRKVLSVRPSAEPDNGEVVHDREKPGTGNKAWSAEPVGRAGVATLVDCADRIAAATDLWRVARPTCVGCAATSATRKDRRRMNVFVENMIEEGW